MSQFRRKWLGHEGPGWVDSGSIYFVTINVDRNIQPKRRLIDGQKPKLLVDSIEFRIKQGELYPHLLVLMPDHLHLLSSFSEEPGMKRTIASWKRWTARSIGIQWQQGFFDHRMRSSESLEEKENYLRMNPVRAGLVSRSEDWPHTYTWAR